MLRHISGGAPVIRVFADSGEPFPLFGLSSLTHCTIWAQASNDIIKIPMDVNRIPLLTGAFFIRGKPNTPYHKRLHSTSTGQTRDVHLNYQDQIADAPISVINQRVSNKAKLDGSQGMSPNLRKSIPCLPFVGKPDLKKGKKITAKLEMKPVAQSKLYKNQPHCVKCQSLRDSGLGTCCEGCRNQWVSNPTVSCFQGRLGHSTVLALPWVAGETSREWCCDFLGEV